MALVLLLSLALRAADPFEAVSIHRTDPLAPRDSIQFAPGGRFLATNISLEGLIRIAYDVRTFQISGGPKWLDSDRFDVECKASGNPSQAEIRLMLQAMLAGRFQLKVRRGTREMPVYWLVVAPGGFKLRATSAESGGFRIGDGQLSGNATIAGFSRTISNWMDRAVVDKTGLMELMRFISPGRAKRIPGSRAHGSFACCRSSLG